MVVRGTRGQVRLAPFTIAPPIPAATRIGRLIAPVRDGFLADSATADFAGGAIRVGGTRFAGLRPVRQPEAGQRHTGQTDTELLQRRAARDRLS